MHAATSRRIYFIFVKCFLLCGFILFSESIVFGQVEEAELEAEKSPTVNRIPDDARVAKYDEEESDADPKDLLAAKGITNDIADELSQLIKFEWDERKISPVIQTADANTAYETVREIQKKIGFGGGGSSWGGDTWSFSVNSQKLNFLYQRNKVEKSMVTRLSMIEMEKPQRKFDLTMGEKGTFQLSVEGKPGSGYLFRLTQKESGEFVTQEINGTEIKSFVAKDFEHFCKEHSSFTTDRLVPMFEHFGFGNLITPFSTAAKDHVLNTLVPLTDAQLKEFDTKVKKLNSNSYAEREQATKELNDNYASLRDVLMRVAVDKRLPPEVRDRAAEVVQKQEKGDVADVVKFVTARKLATNTAYLLWLLDNEDRDKFKQQIVRQICEIEDLKTSVKDETFEKWLVGYHQKLNEASSTTQEQEVSTKDLLANCIALKKAKPGIGSLLKFKLVDNTISLDTDHWAKPFGGKSIKEHSDAIKKELKARGLPDDWYSSGGEHPETSAGFEQVLFERMENEMEVKKARYNSYSNNNTNPFGRSNKNRKIEGQNIKAELVVNDGNENGRAAGKKESNYRPKFLLMFEEQNEARSELLVAIDRDESIQVRFSNLKDNAYIRLLIDKNKEAIIQDIRGNHVMSEKAASFSELVQKNQQYFSEEFFPMLDGLGVTLDAEQFKFKPFEEKPK